MIARREIAKQFQERNTPQEQKKRPRDSLRMQESQPSLMQGLTTDHHGKLLPIKKQIRLPDTNETTLHYIHVEPNSFNSEKKSNP